MFVYKQAAKRHISVNAVSYFEMLFKHPDFHTVQQLGMATGLWGPYIVHYRVEYHPEKVPSILTVHGITTCLLTGQKNLLCKRNNGLDRHLLPELASINSWPVVMKALE
jgi:hypothetical protein